MGCGGSKVEPKTANNHKNPNVQHQNPNVQHKNPDEFSDLSDSEDEDKNKGKSMNANLSMSKQELDDRRHEVANQYGFNKPKVSQGFRVNRNRIIDKNHQRPENENNGEREHRKLAKALKILERKKTGGGQAPPPM